MNYIRHVGVLFFALLSSAIWAQTVSGTVTDENNQPLPGATIVVQGTNNGTTTDFNGKYQISAKQGQTLVFSYVGFATQNVVVTSVTHSVIMRAHNPLDEIIVTGYGSQKRLEVTGSAVQLDGDKISTLTVPTIDQALQGNVSGLVIAADSGTPGSTSQIRIRGISSITAGNEPLFVIDGVPITSRDVTNNGTRSSLSSIVGIDANNIQSVTVLKDASSTAQYGARGSNGVILITTKKGSTVKGGIGKETTFQLNSYYGFQNDAIDGPTMLTAAQRLELYAEGLQNDEPDKYATIDAARDYILKNVSAYTAWDAAGRPEGNWAEAITNKNAPISDHNFSVSSSNGKSELYASLGYMQQEATVIGADFERVTAALNVSKQLNDKIRFSSSNSLAVAEQNSIPEGGPNFEGPRTLKFFMSPLLQPYNEDGELDKFDGPLPNTLYTLVNSISRNNYTRIISNNAVFIDLTEKLSFTSRVNIDYQVYYGKVYADRNYGLSQSIGGALTDSNSNSVTYTIQNILDYNFELSEDHGIDFKFLQEYLQNKSYRLTGVGFDFPADGLHYLSSAGRTIAANSNFSDWYVGAYMLAAHYSGFEGKYVADINFRREGNSRFGKENRWGNFWSVGAAWNLHKENFLSNADFINNLKLRTSYGVTGNANISINQYQAKLGYVTDYAGEGAIETSTFGNDDLSWETSKTLDVALEFTLFDAFFDGSFGFFKRTSSDMLFTVPLSSTTGFFNQARNIGSLENKGIEFDYNFNLIQSNDFNLSLSGNIATVNNEVTKLAKDSNGKNITIANSTRKIDVGHPVNGWRMATWAGVNPETGEEEFFVNGIDGDKTTDIKGAEVVWQGGSALPTITGGMSLNMDYKGFFAEATGTYAGGHKIYESYHGSVNSNYVSAAVKTFNGFASLLTESWKKEGDIARNGKISTKRGPGQISSKYLHDGDFFRLRTVTFGYNFPDSIIDYLGIDRLRIYARGNNLYTWQKAKHLSYDPEVGLGSGQVRLQTPSVKSITFGINLNF